MHPQLLQVVVLPKILPPTANCTIKIYKFVISISSCSTENFDRKIMTLSSNVILKTTLSIIKLPVPTSLWFVSVFL